MCLYLYFALSFYYLLTITSDYYPTTASLEFSCVLCGNNNTFDASIISTSPSNKSMIEPTNPSYNPSYIETGAHKSPMRMKIQNKIIY